LASLGIPPVGALTPFVGGVLGALTVDGVGPTELQHRILTALLASVHPDSPDTRQMEPWPAEAVVEGLGDTREVLGLAHMTVILEMTMHPLPGAVERHVESYLAEMGVETPYVAICRDTAHGHLVALHADMIRNSWTTEETIKGVFHGQLLEMARSKLSYYGVGHDRKIADRWRNLGDCPNGSWGSAVYDFYQIKKFPFPGEKHGIYEIGAHHDWIHVLCDYDTDPEGEIDVFAFIAATMDDPKGFIHFLFTIALFQNATLSTVGGRKVLIARADTLADVGAPGRLADSFRRASWCTADVMGGIEQFDYKDVPLEELRSRWNIPPKQVPARSWRD
jgi:hypothetical protein